MSQSSSHHGRGSPPRGYNPTMRVRDAQLFDADVPVRPAANLPPPKPFRQHLLDTRGKPIPPMIKALLGLVALIVVVFLLLAVYRFSLPKAQTAPPPGSSTRP